MRIVADQNLSMLSQTFGCHGELRLRPGRAIGPADVRDADALLVRSVTRVDRALLKGSRVRFVGSATIGRDHLDTAWLEAQGVRWASAPGCNANAAAEYSLAMIALALARRGRDFSGLSAGIVGRGNVGSRTLRLLSALGVECVACDPPLAEQGEPGLVSLERALHNDLVCLHVPLTHDGPCPTWRMLDGASLASLPDGALLLNTARGNVVDGAALQRELARKRLLAALDVWPGEPCLDPGLVQHCLVATPHVAGYSQQGRTNGVRQIYQAFCDWSGEAPSDIAGPALEARVLALHDGVRAVQEATIGASGVGRDDEALRSAVRRGEPSIPAAFDALRRDYPVRPEFSHWRIAGAPPGDHAALQALGFQLA